MGSKGKKYEGAIHGVNIFSAKSDINSIQSKKKNSKSDSKNSESGIAFLRQAARIIKHRAQKERKITGDDF